MNPAPNGGASSTPEKEIDKVSNYIKQTKDGSNYNYEVRAPIRKAKKNDSIEDMLKAPVMNVENRFKSTSILSKLDGKGKTYSDIEGVTVLMITEVQGDVMTDEVIVRGEMSNFYIVEIDGVKYSVLKSCATFVKFED